MKSPIYIVKKIDMKRVGELIEELQKLDPEGEVYVLDRNEILCDFDVDETKGVETQNDGNVNITMLKAI